MTSGQARREGCVSGAGTDGQEQLHRRCVLLVEDDRRIRELMAMLLEAEDFDTVELTDGMEALKYLAVSEVYRSELRRPDLIIADINMPNYSGLDLLMGLRESRRRPPVMLVTGIKDEEIHREARKLGAARVVLKPFDIDYFLEAVEDSLTSCPAEAVVEPKIVPATLDAKP